MLGRIASLALLAVAACSSGTQPVAMPQKDRSQSKPMRIVSINPCADAILMQVADHKQISAISHYSQDPEASSIDLRLATRFAVTDGTAEEVIALQPDLVISGPHVAIQTIAALERLHIPLLKISVAESVNESQQQVADIAKAVGHEAQGRALNLRISHAVALAKPADSRPVSALIWQNGGLVPGAGTLADELLAIAGFRNHSPALGLKKWDMLALEPFLLSPPQVVLTAKNAGKQQRLLSHPVMRQAAKQIMITDYPWRLLTCAGPNIIPALARLKEVRQAYRHIKPAGNQS